MVVEEFLGYLERDAELEVLREELAAGKESLAVFYGAGHLQDMAERLEKDFGMKETKTTWLNAWDLKSSQ